MAKDKDPKEGEKVGSFTFVRTELVGKTKLGLLDVFAEQKKDSGSTQPLQTKNLADVEQTNAD